MQSAASHQLNVMMEILQHSTNARVVTVGTHPIQVGVIRIQTATMASCVRKTSAVLITHAPTLIFQGAVYPTSTVMMEMYAQRIPAIRLPTHARVLWTRIVVSTQKTAMITTLARLTSVSHMHVETSPSNPAVM